MCLFVLCTFVFLPGPSPTVTLVAARHSSSKINFVNSLLLRRSLYSRSTCKLPVLQRILGEQRPDVVRPTLCSLLRLFSPTTSVTSLLGFSLSFPQHSISRRINVNRRDPGRWHLLVPLWPIDSPSSRSRINSISAVGNVRISKRSTFQTIPVVIQESALNYRFLEKKRDKNGGRQPLFLFPDISQFTRSRRKPSN